MVTIINNIYSLSSRNPNLFRVFPLTKIPLCNQFVFCTFAEDYHCISKTIRCKHSIRKIMEIIVNLERALIPGKTIKDSGIKSETTNSCLLVKGYEKLPAAQKYNNR